MWSCRAFNALVLMLMLMAWAPTSLQAAGLAGVQTSAATPAEQSASAAPCHQSADAQDIADSVPAQSMPPLCKNCLMMCCQAVTALSFMAAPLDLYGADTVVMPLSSMAGLNIPPPLGPPRA